jgi:hypothetical protein
MNMTKLEPNHEDHMKLNTRECSCSFSPELSLQMKEQALKFKQELRAQDLTCKLLKEKLTCKEAELEQRNDDVVALEQRRDWLEAEVLKLQRFLGEANQKISSLEHQVCGSTTSSYLCPVILIASVLLSGRFLHD